MELPEAEKRHRELILSNELVKGDEAVADIICAKSEFVSHQKGYLLISEGDEEDTVYFILKGSVSVQNKIRHLADKQAPETVGEMAAKRVGSKRSADVTVSSNTAHFRALSGLTFRQLINDHPTFKDNLELLIDNMNREKIAQLGETTSKKGVTWPRISGFVGLLVFIVLALYMWSEGLAWKLTAVSSISSGVVSFVLTMLLNPALIYRNMFRLSATMLIGLVAYGSISFAASFITKDATSPYFLDLRWETDSDIAIYGINVFALLALCLICGWFDTKSSNPNLAP